MDDTTFSKIAESASPRLDRWLASQWSDISRARWQKSLSAGLIFVNGSPALASTPIRVGDSISGSFPVAQSSPPAAQPQSIPLNILFEDDHILCLDKPAGLVVHPAEGNWKGTLVNAVLHHCEGNLSEGSHPLRPGIVHRLDKDTSGCILIAKTDQAQEALSAQFANRTALKTYLAIVRGKPRTTAGVINASIARHTRHRQRMSVSTHPDARAAETLWRVISSADGLSLVECRPRTGRTHQIRVHMKHLGHPIAGDRTYGGGADYPRQLLHAWRLSIAHPLTQEPLSFEAPIPDDFVLRP